jgi:predicted NUDIX family NTP pyrophosphohydrolase
MAKDSTTAAAPGVRATAEDVTRIFGALEEAKLLAILDLRPTVLEVEEASMWLGGDADIFGAGQPLKSTQGDIVAILTADEDDEGAQPG